MNRSPRRRSRSVFALGVVTLCLPLSLAVAGEPAAATTPPVAKSAPPAAASDKQELRHGSRSKAGDGTMLIWDNVTDVFVTPERKDTYWAEERFYQFQDGLWLTSVVLAGPWELVSQNKVPVSARERHKAPRAQLTTRLPSGREAVYASAIKSYKVAGLKGVFLFDAMFYRYDTGVWLASSKEEGPWTPTSSKPLPQVLRRALPVPEVGEKVTLPTGETLVFEGEGNLFAVEGRDATVYYDGAFWERRENKWFTSSKSSSGFTEVAMQKVPGAVRTKYHKPNDPKVKSASIAKEPARPASKKKADGAKPARAAKTAPEAKEARKAKPTADK